MEDIDKDKDGFISLEEYIGNFISKQLFTLTIFILDNIFLVSSNYVIYYF